MDLAFKTHIPINTGMPAAAALPGSMAGWPWEERKIGAKKYINICFIIFLNWNLHIEIYFFEIEKKEEEKQNNKIIWKKMRQQGLPF